MQTSAYNLSDHSQTELIEEIRAPRLGTTELLNVKDGKLIIKKQSSDAGSISAHVNAHDILTGEVTKLYGGRYRGCHIAPEIDNCSQSYILDLNREFIALFPLPGGGGKFEVEKCGNYTVQINGENNVYIVETAMSYRNAVYLGCI